MSVRADLAALLKPLLPKTWKIVPHNGNLDVLDRSHVVQLHQKSIERAPQAPQGVLLHSFSVLIIEPKTDAIAGEDALDEAVGLLIHAIEATPGIMFTRAERVVWNDSNPAYDLALTLYSQKEV